MQPPTEHANTHSAGEAEIEVEVEPRPQGQAEADSGGPQTLEVTDDAAGKRLDQFLAASLPGHSRAVVQDWIKAGRVTLDGTSASPSIRLKAGMRIVYTPASAARAERWEAESVTFDVVFADDDLIVIDKPAGLVVHPGAGNSSGTLVNGILYQFPETEHVPRAGLVHRIDKDTSGLLLVARSEAAHQALSAAIAEHAVARQYVAVCQRVMVSGQTIDAPIARHPTDRIRMAVASPERSAARDAVTHIRVLERFRAHSLIRATLETGRTHQIRVHMAHIGYPLVGDALYGGRFRLPPDPGPELIEALSQFRRQALHAEQLVFAHPISGEAMTFTSPMPQDMQRLVDVLRTDAARHAEGL